MSTRAYILIETVAGTSRDVASELSNMPVVNQVAMITGPYDVVAMLETELFRDSLIECLTGIGRRLTTLGREHLENPFEHPHDRKEENGKAKTQEILAAD